MDGVDDSYLMSHFLEVFTESEQKVIAVKDTGAFSQGPYDHVGMCGAYRKEVEWLNIS